ncbi:MAG: pentapeptide repeat-containing protein [Pseudomonadota bacterium]
MTELQNHLGNGLAFLAVLAGLVLFAAMLGALADLILKQNLRERMGLTALPPALFGVAAVLYGLIAFTLVIGLFLLILATIGVPITQRGDTPKELADAFLFYVLRIAGLTTVLGAVIALPFTLIRLKLTQKQTDTATETLFNEKINAAANDLHAQRRISEWKRKDGYVDIWEDDIIKRNAAIDRLQGLADEYKGEYGAAARIARLLSVYVRELTREYPAKTAPDDASPNELRKWAGKLEPARSDMEKAVQTLGRIRPLLGGKETPDAIDLSGANLQGFRLSALDFRNARLSAARLQGANLVGAQLQGAILIEARLQEADLNGARLQEADLNGARLQGAFLSGAEFDEATSLKDATLRGASLWEVDCTRLPQFTDRLDDIFADASVTPPGGARPGDDGWPKHWATEVLGADFYSAWRAWQRSIGFDPDDPATGDKPQP